MIDIGFVINAQGFWLAMGLTSATGMFIGASLYDGNLSLMKKGILTILFYSFFIVTTIFLRIEGNSGIPIFERHPQSTAGMITVVITTFFYLLGMIIGVYTVKKTLKNKH